MPNEDKRLIGYREDLSIDLGMLEVHWSEHSKTYMKWAELYAEAVSVRDRKKEELDLKSSELDKEIRTDPESFNIPKITEGAISATIKQQTSYQKLSQELINENEIVNILAGAKTAFEHRKKALEGLTQLFCASYFSKPAITQEAKDLLGHTGKEEHEAALNKDVETFGTKKKKVIRRPM